MNHWTATIKIIKEMIKCTKVHSLNIKNKKNDSKIPTNHKLYLSKIFFVIFFPKFQKKSWLFLKFRTKLFQTNRKNDFFLIDRVFYKQKTTQCFSKNSKILKYRIKNVYVFQILSITTKTHLKAKHRIK